MKTTAMIATISALVLCAVLAGGPADNQYALRDKSTGEIVLSCANVDLSVIAREIQSISGLNIVVPYNHMKGFPVTASTRNKDAIKILNEILPQHGFYVLAKKTNVYMIVHMTPTNQKEIRKQ